MCGRFTHRFTWAQIHRLLTLSAPALPLKDSFNVAPTQFAPVIRVCPEGRSLDLLRWGLIPSWARDPAIGNSLINARAESVATKPAFRAAFRARRCLVPASGFYEWRKADGGKSKQPYYIHPTGDDPFLFAGLWESWISPEGEVIESFVIITTAANSAIAHLHDRMPVILDRAGAEAWLDPNSSLETVQSLLRPCPPQQVASYPVATAVNSPSFNAPECTVRAAPPPEPESQELAAPTPTLFEM